MPYTPSGFSQNLSHSDHQGATASPPDKMQWTSKPSAPLKARGRGALRSRRGAWDGHAGAAPHSGFFAPAPALPPTYQAQHALEAADGTGGVARFAAVRRAGPARDEGRGAAWRALGLKASQLAKVSEFAARAGLLPDPAGGVPVSTTTPGSPPAVRPGSLARARARFTPGGAPTAAAARETGIDPWAAFDADAGGADHRGAHGAGEDAGGVRGGSTPTHAKRAWASESKREPAPTSTAAASAPRARALALAKRPRAAFSPGTQPFLSKPAAASTPASSSWPAAAAAGAARASPAGDEEPADEELGELAFWDEGRRVPFSQALSPP